MKRKFIWLTLATVLIGIGSCNKNKSLDKALRDYALEMNKKCPILVDPTTQLDRVVNLPGNQLAYQMTTTILDKQFLDTTEVIKLEDWEHQMRVNLIEQIQKEPGMRDIRKNGITVHYNFRDEKGKSIVNFVLSPTDYGN